MLVLPAEPPDTGRSLRSLKDLYLHGFAMNLSITLAGLCVGDRLQGCIVYRLDETISQCIEHRAQRSHIFFVRQHFLSLRTDGAVIHDGTARDRVRTVVNRDGRVDEIAVRVLVSGADFRYLARAAGHRILVTVSASRRIVNRTESAIVALSLLKVLLIEREGVTRGFGNAVTDTLRTRVLLQQRCLEARGCFGGFRLSDVGLLCDSDYRDGRACQQAGKRCDSCDIHGRTPPVQVGTPVCVCWVRSHGSSTYSLLATSRRTAGEECGDILRGLLSIQNRREGDLFPVQENKTLE